MKNILIISYFFPPGNFVASNRPHAFASNLKKFGLNPTVLTRHWEGNESGWEDMDQINETPPKTTELAEYKLIQLPYFSKWYNLCKPFHGFPVLRKLFHTFYLMFGAFYLHESAVECFYNFARDYVKKNRIDYLMVISSPLNIIKLGHLISKQTGVPLITDFRDLWDNKILSDRENIGFEGRLKNRFYEFYLKRWLRSASLITSVNQALIDEINRLNSDAKTCVVMNGFEKKVLEDQFGSVDRKTEKFTFSLVGTVYPHQDASVFIEGLKKFVKGKNLQKIQLNFIGVAVFPEIKDLIEKNLPRECTLITKRISREKAFEKIEESNVLLHVGWKGFKGIISVKVLEYLCTGKRIIVAPGDESIRPIIAETKTGEVADSAVEFGKTMDRWYEEWESNGGYLPSHADKEAIMIYSSENQCRNLAEKISEIS